MAEGTKATILIEEKPVIINNAGAEPLYVNNDIFEPQSVNNDDFKQQSMNNQPSSGTPITGGAFKYILYFGATGTLICLALSLIFPIAQVIIGRIYANSCPVSSHIPNYLVVAGSVLIANIILCIILVVITVCVMNLFINAPDNDSEALGVAACICFINCCLSIILSIIGIFMIVWTILGLVWVFSVWDQVQYVDPHLATYCHPVLYKFTYWLFFIPFILLGLSCCLCCVLCSACMTVEDEDEQRLLPIKP